jgi:threonyl-tRNA synthetase
MDDSSERIQAKVKIATDMKIPYLLVVGPRDAERREVSVRAFGQAKDLGAVGLDAFVEALQQEVSTRGKVSLVNDLFQPATV